MTRRRSVFGRKAWNGLTPIQRASRDRALDALARMRSGGQSLTRAAREAGTTPAVVRKYVGSALRRTRDGGVTAKASDRLYRRMTAITPDGPALVEVRGSRAASLIGKHANAVRKFVETGDARDLHKFRGKTVGGRSLATDPEVLRRLARRGEVEFEDIYELTT
jgi:hypothetical protein